MTRAYDALGDPENALKIYQPLFNQHKNFEHYATVKRLTTAVNPQRGQALTQEIITELQNQLPNSLYLLCQVYLSEGHFDLAYELVKQQGRYHNLDSIKLVAKAHLLAGFGPKATPEMGSYLHDLYVKVEQADKDATQFLREQLLATPALDAKTVVAHAENLYRNIMQMHIDNGRKTYATAAYYCALLGEIARYDGRGDEFKHAYQELRDRYPRHRALLQELAAKVKL